MTLEKKQPKMFQNEKKDSLLVEYFSNIHALNNLPTDKWKHLKGQTLSPVLAEHQYNLSIFE
jgi:hypothetical protein